MSYDTRIRKAVPRTSRLLNISSSRNSETPNLRELASAKATPTIRVVPPLARTSLTAMTSGDERLSILLNKRSSSCWRFPGEAYKVLKHIPRLRFNAAHAPPFQVATLTHFSASRPHSPRSRHASVDSSRRPLGNPLRAPSTA